MYNKLNKSGSAFLTIAIAIAFFMFGILILSLIMPDIATTRDLNNLDCKNMSITDGNKMSCLGVDGIAPAFIIALVIVGGGAIVYKLTGR